MKQKRTDLQKARKRKGWSQNRMAQALGVSLRTYQNYEYCERSLSLETADEISKILEISIDALLVRNSTTPPNEKIRRSEATRQGVVHR